MDRKTLKAMAKEQIKGNIGMLFLISLIVFLLVAAISMIPVAGSIAAELVLIPWFAINTILIYLNLTKSIKPQIADLFKDVGDFWPALKVQLLVSLLTILWMLIFYVPCLAALIILPTQSMLIRIILLFLPVIPTAAKTLSYSQAMYIIAENPDMPALEAIDKSKKMMHGHRLEYYVLSLSFIGWALLGALTFGILYIWITPYMCATYANFYNSIKPEKEAPEAVSAESFDSPAEETSAENTVV